MASQQSATVYIANNTNGNAVIELFHQNSSNGTQSGRWQVAPGGQAGPLTVYFETGIGSAGILDYWWVYLTVMDGSAPGQYVSGGSMADKHWKECQLQYKDAGQTLSFSVSTTVFNINEKSGACSNGMEYIGAYGPITNFFVLMLENHSFDNLFAMSGIPGIIAATTSKSNSYNGSVYHVDKPAPLSMPSDPGHEFLDTVEQLAGAGAVYTSGGAYPAINNSGFASNYATTPSEGTPPPATDVGDIMKCFDTPNQLPVLYQLATEFALCDQWFSSMPGPTWPNRFFVHGASSAGLDHSPTKPEMAEWETAHGFDYPFGSIFDALTKKTIPWRIYIDNKNQFSDDPGDGSITGAIAQASAIKNVYLWDVKSVSHFAADLQNPYPYKYTFIEPNYGNLISGSYEGGSSQHPMDDVYGGESLVKAVYEAIRNSPVWNTSLLIVTYDEHGGFYDSVAPGSAPAPNDNSPAKYNRYGFTFDQYGVRVPAIVISPLIPAKTVDHTVYDHTSVLATVETLFSVGSLTQRDATARTVMHLCTLASPRTDCPAILNSPAPFMKREKPVILAETMAAKELESIPQTGNLPGFLHVMLKTDIELSTQTDAEKAAIIAKFNAINTRGEAKTYIEYVMAKVEAVKAAGGKITA